MTNPDREELVRLADLRSANVARQKEWDADNQITLVYRGNELAGEVGEACNVIKKLERERLGIAGSRDTVAHLAEELTDVVICADLIAMHEGIDLLGEAVPAKFNATSEKVGLKTRLASSDGGVKVRELEWTQTWDAPDGQKVWCADPANGALEFTYSIWLSVDGRYHAPKILDGYFGSLDAAKTAAQADYEARIRSALVEMPAVKGEPVAWPTNLNPRTLDLVQRFALALAKKLRLAEEKYGHTDGWSRDDWEAECRDHLYQHLEKGDPRDVAAYCAFMWHHGWITYRAAKPAPPADAGMREALKRASVVEIGEPDSVRYFTGIDDRLKYHSLDQIIEFADRRVRAAITAPGATTKSDEGFDECAASGQSCIYAGDGPNGEFQCIYCGKPGSSGPDDDLTSTICAGIAGLSDPSSTRSDVTVEFGDLVDDLLLVVAEARRQNWKNGGAHLYDDEDAARKIARALLETHQIRRK